MFGFSRGAYTVRVLAGLIHKIGLITPEQVNLAGSGLIAYKQFSSDVAPKLRAKLKTITDAARAEDELPPSPFDNAAQFARITSSRWPTIRFVGVWDTVASVIVPRPDRFYWPSLEELAWTLQNPSVQTFRQAISIDERRAMFRLKKWYQPQTYKPVRFNAVHAAPQDILQVWFRRRARRYRRRLSGKGTRAFQISAALDDRRGRQMRAELHHGEHQPARLGHPAQEQPVLLCSAGYPRRFAHVAARRVVDPREISPKRAKYKEWPARTTHFGYYIPDAEPRLIPDGAMIYQSVIDRMNAMPSYRPVNMPAKCEPFPMPVPPGMVPARRMRRTMISAETDPSSVSLPLRVSDPPSPTRGEGRRTRNNTMCDCLTGKSRQNLSSPRAKNIPLAPSGKSKLKSPPSRPTGGAYRDRHGRRCGMRWPRQCPARKMFAGRIFP